MNTYRSVKPAGSRFLLSVVLLVVVVGGASVSARADELQSRFEEASEALDANRIYTARRLFQELLEDEPSLHRARLELARAHYLARDLDAAEAEAERVLEDPDVPSSVRTTLLAFLAQIRDDRQRFAKKHRWNGDVYAGVMYDSNANFGLDRDRILTAVGEGEVPEESRERSDGAFVLEGGITHTYNPNRRFRWDERTGNFLWLSRANAYYREYWEADEFNLGVLTFRTGPAWVVPDVWRFGIGLQADQIYFGDRNLALFTSVNPEFTWQTSDVSEVTIEATLADRDYKRSADSGRDGTYKRLGISGTRAVRNGRVVLSAGGGVSDFEAEDDRFSYKGPDLFAGITVAAWPRGSVYGRLGYRNYDFVGVEPAFLESRDDDEWRASVGFRHNLVRGPLAKWQVRGDVSWYENDADEVPIYDYDRTQVSLGLARSF